MYEAGNQFSLIIPGISDSLWLFSRSKQVDKIISPDSFPTFLEIYALMPFILAPVTEFTVNRELTHVPHTWFLSGMCEQLQDKDYKTKNNP